MTGAEKAQDDLGVIREIHETAICIISLDHHGYELPDLSREGMARLAKARDDLNVIYDEMLKVGRKPTDSTTKIETTKDRGTTR